jgi:hypothetical protein
MPKISQLIVQIRNLKINLNKNQQVNQMMMMMMMVYYWVKKKNQSMMMIMIMKNKNLMANHLANHIRMC